MADVDFQLVSTILLLCGDQQIEVSTAAHIALTEAVELWDVTLLGAGGAGGEVNENVTDGEWEMISAAPAIAAHNNTNAMPPPPPDVEGCESGAVGSIDADANKGTISF
jgi:hypothetical protein